MGSSAEETSNESEGPISPISDDDTTISQPEPELDKVVDGDESQSKTPHERRRKSKALIFARNCIVILALFALLSFGTSTFSKANVVPPSEQVVKLGDAMQHKMKEAFEFFGESVSFKDIEELEEPWHLSQKVSRPQTKKDSRPRTKQDKGRRKRPHRKIKPRHPEIGLSGDNERRLQGMMGGMMGGRSGSFDHSGSFRSGFFRYRTFNPTPTPSASPSASPVGSPSASPSRLPSVSPSTTPSKQPSASPTTSKAPSRSPSSSPSESPSVSKNPSGQPSLSLSPSVSSRPSRVPSSTPSISPTLSKAPSASPSRTPSKAPSSPPSIRPSQSPSFALRTFPPTVAPTDGPRTPRPTFGTGGSRSRSRMGMGMMRGRSFSSIDQQQFNAELQDLIAFLPPDFLALFGNN
ncbi:Similarities with uniprot P08640 Saccharomyces cerevisiae YIR019c STA1 [Seminavis robusta]|uniref:Similarities with uniprot P08640 Saccharomyces cerevisiae YIR019c STA1 n=1 Tax=Seminavis robusta TaxID=568900 RepID=A0A9N8DWA9_9STRA|nr:Similarities with uniprot P08640 Saccharomyces cerevisiae YIR019c STA1 [Seminavis robusta]|eukprot:Sro295_g110480.1 Similarities with uniprot P08640 Saccharomyces cerevisiae YIR019c STA1 (407) ;mRNA; r:45151-46371